jgi:hypothetical protein
MNRQKPIQSKKTNLAWPSKLAWVVLNCKLNAPMDDDIIPRGTSQTLGIYKSSLRSKSILPNLLVSCNTYYLKKEIQGFYFKKRYGESTWVCG